ncbi:hypothetical protein PISMIDRAFT_674834 [Pisolithus microcarpus 441]|uniref:Uncharacterized protein n=1 Tax=Pisolithus microcarpus 441 TaxID=765257 RepID=A0A0D0A615_9AGAM|nr:hypothetical protein PISMIDRAFT_674834 [Pisolithus microcarpus 441]
MPSFILKFFKSRSSVQPKPPPDTPPVPEEVPLPIQRGWCPYILVRKQRQTPLPQTEPGIATPRHTQSSAIWHPNPPRAPTPPSVEPTLVIPDRYDNCSELLGPRSPRGSFH